MAFEEWWQSRYRLPICPRCTRSEAEMIWNAAKEENNEVEQESVTIGRPYGSVTWHVVKKDNDKLLFEALSAGRCVEWAIENGYRIAGN